MTSDFLMTMPPSVIFFLLLTVGMIIFSFLIPKVDWLKNEFRFVCKKGIDCGFSLLIYSFIVLFNYISQANSYCTPLLCGIVSAMMALPILWYSICGIGDFLNIDKQVLMAKKVTIASIIVDYFVALLCGSAALNYIIYIFSPSQFCINDKLTHAETGFEFLYYTFNLMITYSGATIEATTPLSKIIQIVEIIFFYVTIGVSLTNLVNMLVDKQSANN